MTSGILFLAAENAALAGGKAGGIGDVVRDLPRALGRLKREVFVMTPGYGFLGRKEGFESAGTLTARFRGGPVEAELLLGPDDHSGVTQMVVEHPMLETPSGQIYVDDAGEPFASDASRFALLSALAAEWLRQHQEVRIVHLHDWHAAPLLLLREYSDDHRFLRRRHCVMTIHNLAYQGIRPLGGNESSPEAWFPGLELDERVIDRRWTDCVNLMRAGILLADVVSTVSPSYAEEIQLPDEPAAGVHGGEGLERDLQAVAHQGKLLGILNGCDYPDPLPGKSLDLDGLGSRIMRALRRMMVAEPVVRTSHLMAMEQIREGFAHRGVPLICIGRVVEQKLGLFRQPLQGKPALHHLLERLGHDGVLLLLGSGEPGLSRFLRETAAAFDNFLFIDGFDEQLALDLYRSGKLFLMPSAFEPCGLAQMLAMRAGQPCLVHHVGGLKDTVRDGVDGWAFIGKDDEERVRRMVERFDTALASVIGNGRDYQKVCRNAREARFSWDAAAQRYIDELYEGVLSHAASG